MPQRLTIRPQAIYQKYRDIYDRDLWSDIKSDTSGDFRLALKGLVLTEARFVAEELRSAMVLNLLPVCKLVRNTTCCLFDIRRPSLVGRDVVAQLSVCKLECNTQYYTIFQPGRLGYR